MKPAAVAAVTDKVALRSLIVALDANDFGVATWKSSLDRVGTPYDVVLTKTEALPALTLANGTGKYEAVLLTSNSLLYDAGGGNYTSGLDATEWTALWDYERTYHVRQVSLYTSYGTWPEDYCLNGVSEGGIGDTPQNAALTAAGASVFDYLKATAQIPISLSYVYRTAVRAGCAATPILTLGGNVLGVTSTSTDGRERLALTFSSNQYLTQTSLLTYGLLRWATKGVFVGEQRHWLNVDVDDWFNTSDHLYADGHLETDPGYRTSGPEVAQISAEQNTLRSTYPLAAGFTLNLAFNGEGIGSNANLACLLVLGDPLTVQSQCHKSEFRWINHTFSHLKLNSSDYTSTYNEINQNRTAAATLGLSVPTTVLKTGEYSGLGTYNPTGSDVDPPTDFGLGASNPNLLQAAKDLGVKYLHGNMSFPSQVPACFNCAITHPMEPALQIVPDWPTNIWYFSTTPDEETLFYNQYYGPGGKFPYFPVNQTYPQVIDFESNVALQHVMNGSAYSHTMHIGNVHQYASGKSLTFDWLNATIGKYSAYYNVPLRNPQWTDLAAYTSDKTAADATIRTGTADPIWDRLTNQVTYGGPTAGTLFISGVKATGFDTYGTDFISKVTYAANSSTGLTAFPRA